MKAYLNYHIYKTDKSILVYKFKYKIITKKSNNENKAVSINKNWKSLIMDEICNFISASTCKLFLYFIFFANMKKNKDAYI